MTTAVREEVKRLLANADQAHGIDHIDRVLALATRFAGQMSQDIDMKAVKLTALLHDVDDYKLFPESSEEDLPNARAILKDFGVSSYMTSIILDNIRCIGFSKRLKGVYPDTMEAAIVSDADLCDAMGAGGIVRTTQYMQNIGVPFFDKDKWPRGNVTYEQYKAKPSETTVCHIFEKLFRIKTFMITCPGREEALSRIPAMEQFLASYFKEIEQPEWNAYLMFTMSARGGA